MKRADIKYGEDYLYKGQPGFCGNCHRVTADEPDPADVRKVVVTVRDGPEAGHKRPVPTSRLLVLWGSHHELQETLRRCCELERGKNRPTRELQLGVGIVLDAVDVRWRLRDRLLGLDAQDFERIVEAEREIDLAALLAADFHRDADGVVWVSPGAGVLLASAIYKQQRERVTEHVLEQFDDLLTAAFNGDPPASGERLTALVFVRQLMGAHRFRSETP